MKTQNRSVHVPIAKHLIDWKETLLTTSQHSGSFPNQKHRPLVRLQNATTTNFKSNTKSEHIVTAWGLVLTQKPFRLHLLSFKKFCDILNYIFNFVSDFIRAVCGGIYCFKYWWLNIYFNLIYFWTRVDLCTKKFNYLAFVIACKEQARFVPSVDDCFIH
jgi:hypothetical protein